MKKSFTRTERNEILRRTAIVTLVLLFFIVFFHKRIFIVIKSGEAGVLYTMGNGTDIKRSYGEGLHIISPFNTMTVYDVRTQKLTFSQSIISKNGLKIELNYAVLFKPDRNFLPLLHQQVGADYKNTLIAPCVQAKVRKDIGALTPEDIYMTERSVIEKNEIDSLRKILVNNKVIIEGYFISSVVLPDSVNKAITAVYARQQQSEEYDYRLAVERKERQRKIIEAQGIRDFSTILNVAPAQWRALDVTQRLAMSPNSKMIIMGNNASGLPIIMGDQFTTVPTATSQNAPPQNQRRRTQQ
ncbi:Regulator of protease activity HflC, stomatin/prohibitin superfamily [Chitinophaga filiformis]|uniref:Regulator of protease activity HflC, stomatin/prohibitin superfamily n=1 Tax=Chitinophaga filiformis TaxID=104663 RepID=A0A1G7M3E0_CHIFI|nr:Regulator of protease activity HflC, stomatin/prohibitin superfamily [Chitinophaga filiformis]